MFKSCAWLLPSLWLLASASGCGESASRAEADAGAKELDDAPLPSAACATPRTEVPYRDGPRTGELAFMNTTRTFRVHLPRSYDPASPTPLVLMFHGGGGGGLQFEQASSRMDPVADREGFVAVYPDGTGVLKTWNGGGCCGYALENGVDDVGFVGALLDHLEASLCIDRRRIFASGMSNGAILTHRLACELSQRIAAIAPVAGSDNTAACSPRRPVPILEIHGTADGHVPWQGGEGCGPAKVSFTSVPRTVERWRTRNACSGSATQTYFRQGDGHCEATRGCAADVILCAIEGGGHNWPGGEPPAGLVECPDNGFQSSTFAASEVVWAFFAKQSLPRP
jgi:polyhydroxybutyrate depolymerase